MLFSDGCVSIGGTFAATVVGVLDALKVTPDGPPDFSCVRRNGGVRAGGMFFSDGCVSMGRMFAAAMVELELIEILGVVG